MCDVRICINKYGVFEFLSVVFGTISLAVRYAEPRHWYNNKPARTRINSIHYYFCILQSMPIPLPLCQPVNELNLIPFFIIYISVFFHLFLKFALHTNDSRKEINVFWNLLHIFETDFMLETRKLAIFTQKEKN